MTTFVYKAKKSTAETVTGHINAQSEEEAIDLINQLGFLPVSVHPERAEGDKTDLGKKQKVKLRELYFFSRQLANLLKSGITLLRALTIMEAQTHNRYFKKVLNRISYLIKDGKTFSDSLAEFPHIFGSLYITMVNAGEESGNLQEMLVSVSLYQYKQEQILSKVRNALAYPVLMLVVGIGTIYFILSFVMPKMAGLFNSIGESLPLPTKILLSLSSFLSKGGLWILLVAGILGLLAYRMNRSKKGRKSSSRFVLHLPLFGEIILKTQLSQFCRTMELLLRGGVSIIRALQISIPILSNEIIKEHLMQCKTDLTEGGSFGASIRKYPEIPPMMGHLISVGEESGNLTEVLTELAEDYERETNEKIKILTTLLEPIMILTIGLVVGFIVFAMLLPIFQIDVLAR